MDLIFVLAEIIGTKHYNSNSYNELEESLSRAED
jgi:hypothetical protein